MIVKMLFHFHTFLLELASGIAEINKLNFGDGISANL